MANTEYEFDNYPDEHSERAAKQVLADAKALRADIDESISLLKASTRLLLALPNAKPNSYKKALKIYLQLAEWLFWHEDTLNDAVNMKTDDYGIYETVTIRCQNWNSINSILNSVNKLVKKVARLIPEGDDDGRIICWFTDNVDIDEDTLTPKEAEAYENGEFYVFKRRMSPEEMVETAAIAVGD